MPAQHVTLRASDEHHQLVGQVNTINEHHVMDLLDPVHQRPYLPRRRKTPPGSSPLAWQITVMNTAGHKLKERGHITSFRVIPTPLGSTADRAANRFVSYQDRKAVSASLKTIYTAASEQCAREALEKFADSPRPEIPLGGRDLGKRLGAVHLVFTISASLAPGYLYHQCHRVA
mgnify:CR=1 FL=1